MCPYASVLVLLTAIVCTLALPEPDHHVKQNLPFTVESRQRRSLWSAWRQVLRGAWVGSSGPSGRWYYKIGGLEEAMADFKSLNPTNVFTQSDGVMGLVGERRVHVYSSDGFTILGIMGKDATLDAPYKGFRSIQYIKRPEDAIGNRPPFL